MIRGINPYGMTEQEYRVEFAHAFSEWLKRTGTTQREVADAMGMDHATVYKWTAGQSLPNLYRWERLVLFVRKREREWRRGNGA